MNALELILAILALVFLGRCAGIAFVLSIKGKDVEYNNRLKRSDPKRFRNLRILGFTNGLIVTILSFSGIIAAPILAFDKNGGIFFALSVLILSCVFFWLSGRWILWALRQE
jgi:hypothetical protein